MPAEQEILPPIEQTIKAVVIYNPLDPADCVKDKVLWRADATVADYIDGVEEIDWEIAINGELIDRDKFDVTMMRPDDHMMLFPVIHSGGGGKKSVMRLAIMIAIMVVAPEIAPLLLGEVAAGATIIGSFTVGQAVAVGFTMAANLVLGAIAPAPRAPAAQAPQVTQRQEFSDSPSFGIDGPKNTTKEDTPLPVVYGTFRMGGNRISVNTQNDGNTQFIRMLMAVSEGPIESVTDFQVDGQPVANYQDVLTDFRLGTDNQALIGWFEDTKIFDNVNRIVTEAYDYLNTTDLIDKLRFDFVASGGLVKILEGSGNRESITVPMVIDYTPLTDTNDWVAIVDTETDVAATARSLEVTITAAKSGNLYNATAQYRAVGGGGWSNVGSPHVNRDIPAGETGNIDITFTTPTPLAADQYEIQATAGTIKAARESTAVWTKLEPAAGGTNISGQQRTAIRRSFESDVLTQDRYRVRVRRTSENVDDDFIQDDVIWADLVEIIVDDVAYNHTAMSALEIRLNDQINRVPRVTALIKGRTLDTYDIRGNVLTTEHTPNPAWVVADMLTNTRYGASYAVDRIDWPAWLEWADFCDAESLEFNAPMDFHTNLWDAMQAVFTVGRANIVFVGTKISVIIDRDEPVSMVYGEGNILEDSFTLEWLAMEERATEIEVTFFDAANDFKSTTLRVSDFIEIAKGRVRRPAAFTLLGVTDIQQAQFYADILLAQNRLITQKCNFDVSLESISSVAGSIIGVQHTMSNWGTGGRTKAGSTTTVLELDTPVTMETGKTYRALCHLSAVKRWDATVEIISSGSIFVSGITDASKSLHRIKMTDGTDVDILKVVAGSPYDEIVLDYVPAALLVTDVVELWDTEVIEEQDVVLNVGVDRTQITLQTALSQAPVAYTTFMFGETNSVVKPFRLSTISRDDEFRRTIRGVEHVAAVYTPTGTTATSPEYTFVSPDIGQVLNIDTDEELVAVGNVVQTRVHVSWDFPANGVYEGAEIFIARNGGLYFSEGTAHGRATSFTFIPPIDGEALTIKVVAFDGVGQRPSFDAAPTIGHTVVGKLAKPAQVQNFTVVKVPAGIKFDWSPVVEADVIGYEIREGTSWDVSTLIVTNHASTSFTTVKSATGTYTFHIKAIDSGGRQSELPAVVILALTAPATVVGFNAVQNGSQIELVWNRNTESDISGYEIREGLSFESGTIIIKVASTRFNIPTVGNDSARKFWIKAFDTALVESTVAAFTTLKIAEAQIQNVVAERLEKTNSFPATRIHMATDASGLKLDVGESRGEYVFPLDIAETRFARVFLEDKIDFVATGSPIWSAASFTWTAPAAQNAWLISGDTSNMLISRNITKRVGLGTATEIFTLNDDTTGENSTSPVIDSGPAHSAGRFLNGVLMDDLAQLAWDMTIPSEFKLQFYARPKIVGIDVRYLDITGTAGKQLTLDYQVAGGNLVLAGSDGNDIVITAPVMEIDVPMLIMIVQTTTDRKLYAGRVDDFEIQSGSLAVAGIGAFTRLSLN